MDSIKLANALCAALRAVSTLPSGYTACRLLLDDDIPRLSKAALVCMLEEQMKERGVNIPLDMFSPFYKTPPSSFVVRAPLVLFLDAMFESMAGEFVLQLTSLLEMYSPRSGHKDKRWVLDIELQHIATYVNADMLQAMSDTIRHLQSAISYIVLMS